MGTSFSVRGAWPLAALLLLASLLHGDATSMATHRRLQDAEREPAWSDAFWAHETDAVSAAIAERAMAAGYTYGHARWWLAKRCPQRGMNGTVDRITKRCYARGLRTLEKQARPQPPPPPQQESQEDEARRYALMILTCCPQWVYPWPETILNPVIKTRLRR